MELSAENYYSQQCGGFFVFPSSSQLFHSIELALHCWSEVMWMLTLKEAWRSLRRSILHYSRRMAV